MIDNKQMREIIIRPSLMDVNLYCEDAEELLIGVMAVESDGGTYLMQKGGIAASPYQIEPETYVDLWNQELLAERPELMNLIKVKCNFAVSPQFKELANNLKLATIMCRVFFLRVKEPLPNKNDVYAMARYWKKYYNTEAGKGTVEGFVKKYNEYNGIKKSWFKRK